MNQGHAREWSRLEWFRVTNGCQSTVTTMPDGHFVCTACFLHHSATHVTTGAGSVTQETMHRTSCQTGDETHAMRPSSRSNGNGYSGTRHFCFRGISMEPRSPPTTFREIGNKIQILWTFYLAFTFTIINEYKNLAYNSVISFYSFWNLNIQWYSD
jgi:hypothetical protein